MLKYFLIEEYRRHLSLAKRYSFFVFPAYVMFFTAVGAVFINDVLSLFNYRQFVSLVMITTFIYGFGVGSFEFLGRSFEGFNLVNTSAILPLSTRKTYLMAYMRDAIYYTLLFILPMYAGLIISLPISGLSVNQVSFFAVTVLLSMFMGYSASYLSFSLYYILKPLYFAFLLAIFAYLIMGYFAKIPFFPVELQITKAPVYFFLSILFIAILFISAYSITPSEFKGQSRERKERFTAYKKYFRDVLLTKEMLDVIRGGILLKSTLTYFLPMILLFIFVRILSGVSNREIYSPISLSVMLSIFSTVVYSWLTIMDDYRYMANLPLASWDIIKTHMVTHVIIVSMVSVPIIVFLNASTLSMMVPSFALFYLNVFYLLSITSYLAGYRVTSMLFDPEIVMKFSLYSVVPGIILTISSLDQGIYSTMIIILTSVSMIAISIFVLKRSRKKWVYFD